MQWKAHNITDEDMAAVLHDIDGVLQHLRKIRGAGKVLHDRVDDHGVNRIRIQSVEVVRSPLQDLHPVRHVRQSPQLFSKAGKHSWREVHCDVAFTERCDFR